MDRQKTIPPLSTKITRKLAQESAGHNTLMNFYSQISRDETGAPKKWKMSSTLHIDEESIKSKKVGISKGTGPGSNKGTPSNSRENSNERKNQINNSLQKSQKNGRKSRDGSSSDQNSSRESSLESKGEDKIIKKKIKTDKKNRSSSGDSFKQRKNQSTLNTSSSDTGKKKRGPRPRSLDLSSKAMANGDDDHFKSPDPLTPCNIAVKRKKGRPKETPPVLYAEPPVEPSPVESYDSDSEDTSPIIKRGPGRPKKVKLFKTNRFKSIGKGEKMKSFNMKRYEGRGLKQYGSKILKSNLPKGFRRMTKLPKLKPVMSASENNQNDISMESVENEEMKEKGKFTESGMSSEKRRPGRPPGAKNKKYHGPMTTFVTRAKAVKPRNKKGVKGTANRKPGRPPGARNKSTLQRLAENVETISNSSKENSVASEKEVILIPIGSEIETSIGQYDKFPRNAIDEAIDSVVFKAGNDISLESNIKPRVPFRSSVFYKKLSSVKSVAKLKKEKNIIQKIRKKRMFNAHFSDFELGNQTETLASNDLRRKLHSKLIQKMSSESISIPTANLNDKSPCIVNCEDSFTDDKKLTTDNVSVLRTFTAEEISRNEEENLNILPAKIEEKNFFKSDADQVNDHFKTDRKQNIDITKFSDTESVCSELSMNSIGSIKRNIEKQVLILGEDNLESDDQTVRTRQRFEIIPGKKRKRTLSGEFDLLDEKQLRKEKRKVEREQTDDESEVNPLESVMRVKKPLFKKKKSPLKKSPNMKVKEGKIVKKYVSQLTAYRLRMLKQSPFLSRVRKRRRKPLRKGMSDVLLDSLKKLKTEAKKGEAEQEKQNPEIISGQFGLSVSTAGIALDSIVMKSESYRKGLFEKFTDVSLENKADMVVKKELSVLKRHEQEDLDSDDTECTIELKDDIFNEDHDEIPIEESVDDSDTIDFHAEENMDSSGKVLYTESEIEIREMLFDLIDGIATKCETKNQQPGIINLNYLDPESKVDSSSVSFKIKSCEKNKDIICKESVEEKSVHEKTGAKICNENANISPCNENMKDVQYEESTVKTSEQTAMADKCVSKAIKEIDDVPEGNAVVHNLTGSQEIQNPNNSDKKSVSEIVEGQNNQKRKIKYKVRKRRFGPKPLSKKEPCQIATEIKVRKKPGRKPKQKSGEGIVLNTTIDAKSQDKMKTYSSDNKSSPETGITRKFELRQKISRSPLDNIALKQTMEENVYLRNEAQKASRKEAKLKTKAKMAVQDSLESLSFQSRDIDTNESAVTELPMQTVIETQIETEVTAETVDDLLKACKPCKVVLKDFIKELERTQEEVESSCESELENHERLDISVDEKDSQDKLSEAIRGSSSTTSSFEIPSADDTLYNDKSVTEIYDMPEVHEYSVSSESTLVNSESCNKEENMQIGHTENKIVEIVDIQIVTTEHIGDINDNDKKDVEISDTSSDKKQKELRPKRKTPTKTEEMSSLKLAVSRSKDIRKSKYMNEQQTARKTVPPLKIKLKGGFSSRRKTYIVEPSPDSPVEQPGKSENKTEKRKEKAKTKSGNKSESDSEKHNKNHHHHKKRNKTPSDEVNNEQNKAIETSSFAVTVLSEKAAIRATDAYEATFLQFIQDKDKVEQNLAAFSSSLGSRNKPSAQTLHKILQKDSKINDTRLASTPLAVNLAQSQSAEENVSVPVIDDSQNDVDNSSDVQYVCSQCDNVVYKAKEQIIQHYRDVHPGLQFIYKPLPETPENIITAKEFNPGTHQMEQSLDNSTTSENNNTEPGSVEENDQSQDDDDDSGSLNLKIVDVVSLKDQQNIIDDEVDISKEEQVSTLNPMQTTHLIQTELRIPSYPIPSGAPPPYPVICGPPPPYSIATGVAPAISGVQELAHLKTQSLSVKPRIQMQSGKIGNSFKCEKCNVHAPMLAAMVAHLRNSHREIPRLFQCPYCKDMEAETEAMIHQHIKKHHPTNNPNPPVALSEPAKRNLKTLSVRLPEGLKSSEGNSIEKDIYMCLKCKEHMPSLETIYEHLEHEHAEVFSYVCPVCKVFKSKTESLVNNHIITDHKRSPAEVNVSLAIDGNHFVRVQCLIKDKAKSGQKATQSVPQKPQISPVPNVMQLSKPTIQGKVATNVLQLQAIQQAVIPQEVSIPPQGCTTVQSLNALQQQTNLNVLSPALVPKPIAQPVQKKKKSLLESIQKIKDQKGLLPQKTGTTASQVIPSHPSQLSSVKTNNAPGVVPPPLMRGPPPLIRYDQLNKVTSAQSTMFGSTVRTSSHFTPQNQTGQTNMQRLQNITVSQATQPFAVARPIQSSLFDTSVLATVKSPQSQRPVLNVPVVSKLTNKSPFSKSPPVNSLSEGTAVVTTGSPLDLTKTSPTGSIAPQNVQSSNSGQLKLSTGGVNPDVFQVFNLRPTQMQLPRQQVPVQQMIAQPIVLPPQVRQNTPSTLAYRPAGPQMIAASQVQQIIGMPVGTAVIRNMVVSLGNVSQGVSTIPGVTQISPLQNAQFVRMTSPQVPASTVTVLNSSESSPVATQAQPKTPGTGQQVLNKNMLFKCPYCPNLTPLRLDQVQPHIENKHPGSTILFKPFDSR